MAEVGCEPRWSTCRSKYKDTVLAYRGGIWKSTSYLDLINIDTETYSYNARSEHFNFTS